MTLLELYDRAEAQGIEIDDFRMRELVSFALKEGYIVIDYSKVSTLAEEKVILAHELGHFETGTFYNADTNSRDKAWLENKAVKRSISLAVPKEAFFEQIKQGNTDHWTLAEFFDVTYEFMIIVMTYYKKEEYYL